MNREKIIKLFYISIFTIVFSLLFFYPRIGDSKTQNLIFNHSFPDGQFKKETDTSYFKSLFPNFKFTPMEKGLNETIKYFVENYKNNRSKLRL